CTLPPPWASPSWRSSPSKNRTPRFRSGQARLKWSAPRTGFPKPAGCSRQSSARSECRLRALAVVDGRSVGEKLLDLVFAEPRLPQDLDALLAQLRRMRGDGRLRLAPVARNAGEPDRTFA